MVMIEMGNTLEEMDNKKILIVGNGFDLAHNLRTRYSDVLEVFKNWKSYIIFMVLLEIILIVVLIIWFLV